MLYFYIGPTYKYNRQICKPDVQLVALRLTLNKNFCWGPDLWLGEWHSLPLAP